MNSNNNELITQIKSALLIEDIIGEKIRLRPSSRGFMGLCPFHQEDTPSFHVYTDTQSYYCFGCHEAGDIFTFTMKTENMNYPEALRLLADRAGVRLPEYSSQRTRNLYDVIDTAAKFFRSCLMSGQGTAARSYMKRRNMNASDVDRFAMGYSPNSWDSLTRHLRDRGTSDREILSCGLAVQSRQGGLYDRFRGRLMFGIKDIAGKIIAFGGRLIDGEGAKYINSPEGSIYHKRNNLYLLDTARKSIREKGSAILVEGYMDAVRLHKCGFTNTTASLGTSLTDTQAELLARFTDRCYICYDSDAAGQNATMKGMYTLAEHGLDVRVIQLPEGKDPDEFLSSHDTADFNEAINTAKSLITHHLSFIAPRMNETAGKRKILQEFFGQISRLDRLYVREHKGEISYTFSLKPDEVEQYINGTADIRAHQTTQTDVERQKILDLEAGLCAMLYGSEDLRRNIDLNEIYNALSEGIPRNCFMDIMTGQLDTNSIAFINKGIELISQLGKKDEKEKWEALYPPLMWHKINNRIQEIDALPENERDLQERFRLICERNKYSR